MKQILLILIILLVVCNSTISQNYSIDKNHSDLHDSNISTNKWLFGIKATQQINYPISHTIIAVTFSKNNHNIYIGPNFTHLFENYFGDEVVKDNYEESSIGLNSGYNYLINSTWFKTNFFLQLDLSVYNTSFGHYNGRFSGVSQENRLIFESYCGLGINYKATNIFGLMGGAGIGGVWLDSRNRSYFLFQTFIGVEFKINKTAGNTR